MSLSIDLAKKNFIELKKKANDVASSLGLGNQKAKVALALDISGSMASTFKNGTVQKVVEELLALGVKFDDNQAIDIFLLGSVTMKSENW
ncbi:VWA domain-containing protein [Cohnella sp.]|uniref:VWA domain-containing protein n=1 Tax=Cohnella sp. TaxID=1883426 RepID=UPI0035615A39